MTAIIGYGLLGSALAERLVAAGHRVHAYDSEPSRREACINDRVTPELSAQAAAATSERVLLSLPNSDITARVLAEIAPALRPCTIVLDTTTSAPEQAEAFAARLHKHAVSYLETNVGGSSDQVRRHEAIGICGGEINAYTQCSDLLDALFRRRFYVGVSGSASRMKLVLNLVLGLNRAVLAEGLSFAIANGIDPKAAIEILRAGPAYSTVMDTKGEKMIKAEFSPQARLSQHLKDVRLILAQGDRLGARLPFTELHRQILQALDEAGYGDEDNSAVIRAFMASPQ